ncbi:hypothetical protein GYMLUDRAFT_251302 [Collybiopsis luxurians FD-317 M1]|uniref:Uncharacterized protein n=1 Tax=Collybiopsis luxurians FD-317 M1 TaxID=944289 RepID=A0A0D0BCZ5_9AGAR|nr:hypothetical protein GYMLUDRAFT_251302 [Collybiopsis luxurians FD-317 M1]
MSCLPLLPVNPHNGSRRWSVNVHEAYSRMNSVCSYATDLLTQEAEPNRLQIHLERIAGEAMPLLVTLEASDEALPKDWLQKCSDAIAQLSIKLASAQESAHNIEDTHISFTEPVIHVKSGTCGCP